MCPWAAARPRAVRAAGPASVGLAAVCAGGRRPAREIATREPSARSGRSRGPPWPCRHPPAPQPGPPVPPAPSTPVGRGVLMRIHIIAEPTPNFARNSPATASSFEFRSLELQRFQTSLKLQPIELRASFLGADSQRDPRHRSLAHPTSEPSHAKPLLGPRPSHAKPSHPALTPLIPEPTTNFARNSPTAASSFELRSLELQRFQTLLKLLPIELRASFLGQTPNTTTGTAAWPTPPPSPRTPSPYWDPAPHTRPSRPHS